MPMTRIVNMHDAKTTLPSLLFTLRRATRSFLPERESRSQRMLPRVLSSERLNLLLFRLRQRTENYDWVDLRGIEPLTSSLRTKRATNCATGPYNPTIAARAGP